MTKVEQSPLGKTSAYVDQYAPSLLFPIPRKEKRDELGIGESLPFYGADIWNAFEISWLNSKGKPIVAVAEIFIDATTPNLIESKSFKLYLNSLNQTRLPHDFDDVEPLLSKDLSAAAGGQVIVKLHSLDGANALGQIAVPEATCLDVLDVEIDTYQTEPELLNAGTEQVSEYLYSNLLKSNCLVTGQPDWGTVFIDYTGPKIDQEGLLKYLISFRQHNEFHEQCVERIFTDLMTHCRCETLTVSARYTRRGGLDINPYRTNVPGRKIPNLRLIRQ